MNGYERAMAMLQDKPLDRLPVMPITMMFAASLIGVPYGKYATDYRVMAEAQIRTAQRFDLDFVSGISDPAREASDCGAHIRYFDDQPPAIDEGDARLADTKALARMKVPDPLGGGRMHDRVKAVAEFRRQVGGQLLIEGWIEGPCAESADLRGINNLMMDFMDDPPFVRDAFAFCVEMGKRFAKAQVDAGADIIGVGDAAASLVGPDIYEEFVWPYEKQLIDAIHAMGTKVRLHICGNTRSILTGMGKLQSDLVDLDYPVPVSQARQAMGPSQVLLGNLDPVRIVRNGTPQGIDAALRECHQQAGPKFIIGAGCEVPRDTATQNMEAFAGYSRAHALREA